MTPEQQALRDAFLAECWRPVREYHPTDGERADAWARNAHLVENPRDASTERKSA